MRPCCCRIDSAALHSVVCGVSLNHSSNDVVANIVITIGSWSAPDELGWPLGPEGNEEGGMPAVGGRRGGGDDFRGTDAEGAGLLPSPL